MFCLNLFQPPPLGWTQPIRGGGGATRPEAGIIYTICVKQVLYVLYIVDPPDRYAHIHHVEKL